MVVARGPGWPRSAGLWLLVVVIAGELALSVAAATGVVGSVGQAHPCHGVSATVFFQPTANPADFQPVRARLAALPGVLEIGFASKQQALAETQVEFAGTAFSGTLTLHDVPASYRVITRAVADARRIAPAVTSLPGVKAVVVGPDVNRPVVTESRQPVPFEQPGLYYVGSVVSFHCG